MDCSRHEERLLYSDARRLCLCGICVGGTVKVFLWGVSVRMAVKPPVGVIRITIMKFVRSRGVPRHVKPAPISVDTVGECDTNLSLIEGIIPLIPRDEGLFGDEQISNIDHRIDSRFAQILR